MGKKLAILMAVAVIAVMVSEPAMAGVGGCGPRNGVGGCWMVTTNTRVATSPTLLESLDGALPVQMTAFLRAMFGQGHGQHQGQSLPQQDDPLVTDTGVGGCGPRIGVGGCWL